MESESSTDPSASPDDFAARSLALAQRIADAALAEVHQEAARLVAEATLAAEKLTAEARAAANDEADRLLAEARAAAVQISATTREEAQAEATRIAAEASQLAEQTKMDAWAEGERLLRSARETAEDELRAGRAIISYQQSRDEASKQRTVELIASLEAYLADVRGLLAETGPSMNPPHREPESTDPSIAERAQADTSVDGRGPAPGTVTWLPPEESSGGGREVVIKIDPIADELSAEERGEALREFFGED